MTGKLSANWYEYETEMSRLQASFSSATSRWAERSKQGSRKPLVLRHRFQLRSADKWRSCRSRYQDECKCVTWHLLWFLIYSTTHPFWFVSHRLIDSIEFVTRMKRLPVCYNWSPGCMYLQSLERSCPGTLHGQIVKPTNFSRLAQRQTRPRYNHCSVLASLNLNKRDPTVCIRCHQAQDNTEQSKWKKY